MNIKNIISGVFTGVGFKIGSIRNTPIISEKAPEKSIALTISMLFLCFAGSMSLSFNQSTPNPHSIAATRTKNMKE